MAVTIQQKVTLAASPRRLFDMYMDPRKHAAVTGGPATVSRRIGSRFSAFGGALRGRMLAVVPGRMVVQSWRSVEWKRDLDSVLVLVFEGAPGGGRITLVHANVPDRRAASIRRGWRTYYWRPWRAYLARTRRRG